MSVFWDLFIAVSLLTPPCMVAGAGTAIEDLPLPQLEQRLRTIDSELEQLASYSLRSGVGPVGYQSHSHRQPDNKEWIRIELGEEHTIDQVVLVPTIWRDAKTGLQAEGFPLAFRILAGTPHTTNVVATFTAENHLLPRIAPLVVSSLPFNASWLGVEATTLSPRGWDHQYVLGLSEILALSGMENVALQKPVAVSSAYRGDEARHERFLVDGFVPYLLDAAEGPSSRVLPLHVLKGFPEAALTIDMGESHPVNQVNLHAVDLSHTIPEAAPSGYAVPRHLRVTGANRPDFLDQSTLFEYRRRSIYDAGPIIGRRFPETSCRYLRIIGLEHQADTPFERGRTRFGFAEIEILSKGRNMALGKAVTSSGLSRGLRSLAGMTDGNNFFGKILPAREWMNQLARRHALELERPLIVAELNRRYANQKTTLRGLQWLAALLGVGIGFTILIDRMLRMRYASRIRERFAADLHDELGANIHTIGLLGDLARDAESRDELLELLDRSRVFTERSGAAVRYCTNMLEAQGLCEDLVEDMKRSSGRLLADLGHDLSFEGEALLTNLKPRKRIDLFLFYKECLNNIIRHSGATQVTTRLNATPKTLVLTITDNGCGLSNGIPKSLRRRARLLHARLTATRPPNGGTCIALRLRTRRWGIS